MKSKIKIIISGLVGLAMMSCSASMQLSSTSTAPVDDIYYTPSKSSTVVVEQNSVVETTESTNKYQNLEKRYADVLSTDTVKSLPDSIVEESSNPYERILSDSYEESYERRLRAQEIPGYDYYTNDYWYAQGYDPLFYNVVTYNGHVWVEPRWLSSMFLWPRASFSLSFGWGNWWYNSWYDPYYSYSYWYTPYSYWYSPWHSWSPYYWGYSNGYWNNYYDNHDYNNVFYGRRTGGTTNVTATNRRTGTSGTQQVVTTRRRGESVDGTTRTTGTTTRIRQSTTQTTRRGDGTTRTGQEVIRRPNRDNDNSVTRTRTDRPTRDNTYTNESTRRSGNSTYQRTRTTTGDGYNRPNTRNQGGSDVNRDRSTTRSTEGRSTNQTYNRPGRVATPTKSEGSSSRERSGSYERSGGSSTRSSGSSVGSSGSSRSSGSSGSSGSSTRSSSGSGSSSGGTRTRK